jgi:ABC-2 type transport system permease protein
MRVLDLVLKDLKQVIRDRKSALFLVVMPILFTLFFGLVLGPVFSSDGGESRLPIAVVNQDSDGNLHAPLFNLLSASSVIEPQSLADSDQAGEMVADGELAAVVIVPPGYSQKLLADQGASLDVIADQGTPAGQTAVRAVETATNRLLAAVESAHISADAYEARVGFESEEGRQAYLQEGLARAIAAWESPPLTVQIEKAVGDAEEGSAAGSMSGFAQSSSGMIVQFAIFGLITSAMILVIERKTGALQRLLTTPIGRVEVILGHTLAMFTLVLIQEAILVILGQYAFDVNYLRQPWAIAVMMVALALWAASLGLLIGSVSRKEDQVIVLSLVAMFVFAGMGGAWFPLEVTGKTFAAIGHLMPTAWAMDGLQNIIVRGQGFQSVLLPAGALLGYTAAFFGAAVWQFGKRE